MAFCKWHNKRLRDVAEWQQDQCDENGMHCINCDQLVADGEESEEIVILDRNDRT